MPRGGLSARRRRGGYLVALTGGVVLPLVLVPVRGELDLASESMLFLLLVVASALLGGLGPALVAGACGTVVLNFFFTRPFGTLRISRTTDVVAVVVFTAVAVMVGWVVDLAGRRALAVREAAELEAGNRLRTALLAAVGHDLRTPLAAAKAAVSGLRSGEHVLGRDDRRELLATADDALDRLGALVHDLLDLSRLQAGAMPVRLAPVAVDDVVARALDDLGVTRGAVLVDLPEDLPDVLADPPLLERVLVNLLANAQRHGGGVPLLTGATIGPAVELRVVDTGPGIPVVDRERVLVPFQRLGDAATGGLGLGLALSRGLLEATGGVLELRDTPGGGLTAAVRLPVAAGA